MAAQRTTDVNEAAAVLRAGGLVALPTETVYGLGANALDATAVARIFAAKQRPFFDPLIVHVAGVDEVATLARTISPLARTLMNRFWPGPLTLVLPRTDVVPDIVTAGLDSVGVRMPDHPVARELIAKAGFPIAAPSANLFGHVSPTTADHVAEQLADRIDMILDGGPCRIGVESTVLDLTSDRPTLLRPGGVTLEELQNAIGEVVLGKPIASGASAPAPGMLERHYSPRTPLRLWTSNEPWPAGRVGLLSFQTVSPPGLCEAHEVLSVQGDLNEAATNLFAAMRRLDAAGVDVILAIGPPETGLGRAINDRLRRAAAKS